MSAFELKMQVTVELMPQLNDVQLSPLAVQHLGVIADHVTFSQSGV